MKNTFYRKPNIIIADDHLIFRQSLKALISAENIGRVVGEASDGNELLDILGFTIPDIVLMDIDMPNMNGMEATQKALLKHPTLSIIVFSMFGDVEYYDKMIELGVKGFILKSSGITEVEAAIDAIMKGKTYFSNILPKSTKNKPHLNIPHDKNNQSRSNIPWW